MSSLSSFTGCMMGGALGDAIGYPVEFMSYDQIIKEHGAEGIKEPLLTREEIAQISDDTQMVLFTAEGLVWAEVVRRRNGYSSIPSRCFCSYQRWLHTQRYPLAEQEYDWMINEDRLEIDSPLLKTKELFHRRAPNATCVEALLEAKNQEYGTIERPINRSKGSGAVVRVAPLGLAFHKSPKRAFEAGCDVAAITHSHPTAYYSAGAFSAMIACLAAGRCIEEAVKEALVILERCAGAEETIHAIEQAIIKKRSAEKTEETLEEMGEGYLSQEALAIGLYCALCYEEDYKSAVCLAANHGGDSTCTASICGSLIGAKMGITGLEPDWIKEVEGKDLILKMASMLYSSYE